MELMLTSLTGLVSRIPLYRIVYDLYFFPTFLQLFKCCGFGMLQQNMLKTKRNIQLNKLLFFQEWGKGEGRV